MSPAKSAQKGSNGVNVIESDQKADKIVAKVVIKWSDDGQIKEQSKAVESGK